jgi:hypothetical protein
MARARNNPAQNFAAHQVSSTEDMAEMARRSGYNMIAGDLDNLAENRRTSAGMPPKSKFIGPMPLVKPAVTRQSAVTKKAQPGDQPGSENR